VHLGKVGEYLDLKTELYKKKKKKKIRADLLTVVINDRFTREGRHQHYKKNQSAHTLRKDMLTGKTRSKVNDD